MTIKYWLLSTLFLSNSVFAMKDFLVERIEFSGLQRVSLGTALLAFPIQEGEMVSQADLQQALRKLFASEHFRAAEIFKAGNVITVKVEEQPTISGIHFSGIKTNEKELRSILSSMHIREGSPVNPSRLREIEKALVEQYHGMGQYTATVDAVLTPLPRARVDLKLLISEGPTSKIAQINFIGNKAFTSAQLRDQLESKDEVAPWNLFGKGRQQYQVPKLEGDIERLRSFYFNRGYIKFSIEHTQVSLSPDKESVYLTFILSEGMAYRIQTVTLSGAITEEQLGALQAKLALKPQQLYQMDYLEKLERDLRSLISEWGYAQPTITRTPVFDETEKTVSIDFNIQLGSRFYVRQIRFEGNSLTNDEILRQELRQLEGSWLAGDRIQRSTERLQQLSYFESVEMELVPVAGTTDQKDIVYRVKEQSSGSVGMSIGYGTRTKLGGTLNLEQDNFLGTGLSINIDISAQTTGINYMIGFMKPYATKSGVSLGANFAHNAYSVEKISHMASYKSTATSLGAVSSIPIAENNYFDVGITYARSHISAFRPQVSFARYLNSIGQSPKDSSLRQEGLSVELAYKFNSLNRGYFPTSGLYTRLSSDFDIPTSNQGSYKFTLKADGYLPLEKNHRWIFVGRLRGSYGDGYGKGKELPFYKNFHLSEDDQVLRGFAANTVGPRAVYRDTPTLEEQRQEKGNEVYRGSTDGVGGNAMVTASSELIFPTPFVSEKYKNAVRTAFFFDAGSLWDTHWEHNTIASGPIQVATGQEYVMNFKNPNHIRTSCGVVLIWRTPFAPIVFSYGFPLKKYPGDDAERFLFSISRNF